MPTRMLREGILDSKAVNSLSEEAELFYRRLYSVVDDYGRFEFDEELLRARVFPRQMDRWTIERIHRVMWELTVDHGYSPLVTVYRNGKKIFFVINKFGQRTQANAKFPDPLSPESTVIHRDPPPSRDEVESKTDTSSSRQIEGLVVNRNSPPTPSKSEKNPSDNQLQEVLEAFDRHQCHRNDESRDHAVRMVMSMNGKMNWERFRLNHSGYCRYWDETGWNFCKLTFLGWINAGCPPSPKAKKESEKSKKNEQRPYNPVEALGLKV